MYDFVIHTVMLNKAIYEATIDNRDILNRYHQKNISNEQFPIKCLILNLKE